jgi:hypothetical protein
VDLTAAEAWIASASRAAVGTRHPPTRRSGTVQQQSRRVGASCQPVYASRLVVAEGACPFCFARLTGTRWAEL